MKVLQIVNNIIENNCINELRSWTKSSADDSDDLVKERAKVMIIQHTKQFLREGKN